MHIRAKYRVFKPKVVSATIILPIPTTVKKAFKHTKWVDAMAKEFEALIKNETYKLVLPPRHGKNH